jgi:hypothetical protein
MRDEAKNIFSNDDKIKNIKLKIYEERTYNEVVQKISWNRI